MKKEKEAKSCLFWGSMFFVYFLCYAPIFNISIDQPWPRVYLAILYLALVFELENWFWASTWLLGFSVTLLSLTTWPQSVVEKSWPWAVSFLVMAILEIYWAIEHNSAAIKSSKRVDTK